MYGDVVALHAHCVLGNSPKITCHLCSSTAKQQSPQGTYEQTTQSCKVQLCSGMQEAHMFKRQRPHSDISPGRWPYNWQQTRHHFPPPQWFPLPVPMVAWWGRSLWLHNRCLLGSPMVGRDQYGNKTAAFLGSPWWGIWQQNRWWGEKGGGEWVKMVENG